VLELGSLDLEEIAIALADQSDYEHRWLIDPKTGEIVFWTADIGVDGQTPVDLDELDLVCIDPLPGASWPGPSRAREPSAGSKMSSTRNIPACCRPGTPSAMPVQRAARSSGLLTTRSSTTRPPTAS
jgi:hypothetical protein